MSADGDRRAVAIAAARGRYVCFLDATDRVHPGWLAAVRTLAERAPGRVLRVGVTTAGADAAPVATSPPEEQYSFDYLHAAPAGSLTLAAYALPVDALRTMHLGFDAALGGAAATLLLAEAVELCGLERDDQVLVATSPTMVRDAEVDLDTVASTRSRRLR